MSLFRKDETISAEVRQIMGDDTMALESFGISARDSVTNGGIILSIIHKALLLQREIDFYETTRGRKMNALERHMLNHLKEALRNMSPTEREKYLGKESTPPRRKPAPAKGERRATGGPEITEGTAAEAVASLALASSHAPGRDHDRPA